MSLSTLDQLEQQIAEAKQKKGITSSHNLKQAWDELDHSDNGNGHEPDNDDILEQILTDDDAKPQKVKEAQSEQSSDEEGDADESAFTWNNLWDADIEQPDDVIEGFMPGASLVMFAGDGGIGKSYVALEMALQVARGMPWLGMDTTQAPVLYIDLENRKWRQALRVEYISKGHSLKQDVQYPVTFKFKADVALDSDRNAEGLRELIEKSGAGLVILDSLVDFLDGLDENSNPEMAEVCKRLRQMIDDTDATIVAIHHVSKGSAGKNWQSSRGASALKDNCDCSIQVVRSGGGTGDILTMRHDKARDFSYKSVKARLNWDNHERLFNTTLFGTGDAKDSTSGDDDEQAILNCLTQNKWRKASEVCDEAKRVTRSSSRTMQRKLSNLVEVDKVLRDENDEHGNWGNSFGVKLA